MRVTVAMLGWQLDWSLEPAADAQDEPAAALNGGTTASYPVEPHGTDQTMGFTLGLEADE